MKLGNPHQSGSSSSAQLLNAIGRFDFSRQSLQALKIRLADAQDNLAETYAILKEIIHRFTGLRLFDAQLAAAHAMQLGRIAELPTGEGKTLSAVVTAATYALRGESVHVLVFNDYLAQRDYSANKAIYEACGLSCGYVVQRSSPEQRKRAYACQVVYVSAKEVGFDHLRDFLCMVPDELLLRTFPVALVDEADSILIDEARIPLVLAGSRDISAAKAEKICEAVTALAADCVSVNLVENQVWLTDDGIEAMQMALKSSNLYGSSSTDVLAQINAALEARFLVAKDKDYIVKEGWILLVDEATGRVAENRKFPDLLQQAVEIREGVPQAAQTVVYNSMSLQAFLRQYHRLCGMTGTAISSASAFKQMYGLEVEVIPPHTPCIRIDHEDAGLPAVPPHAAKRLRRAQREQEGRDTEARYMLERYSALLEEKRVEITAYRTALLLLDKPPVILQNGAPEVWASLLQAHGPNAVMLAERQLTLLFISRHWSDFLSAVEDKRSGIHLEVVGGKNPLEEYRRFILFAFDEMQKDLRRDVVDWMQRCSISENGIDLEAEGLSGATTTWTYLINDSADQFNRIPFLIKTVSNSIRGTLFTVRGLHAKWKQRIRFFTK